jgi:hypothetical protein
MRLCVKNVVKPDRPEVIILLTRFEYWITKATNTHPEYLILIPVPQQQSLHERTYILHRTYTASLVFTPDIIKYSSRSQWLATVLDPASSNLLCGI